MEANPTILVNPKKKKRRRRNPTAPAVNPTRRRRRTSHAKRRAAPKRRRRRNPLVGTMEMVPISNRRRRRRHNPGKLRALGVNIGGAFVDALKVGIGIYGSRYITRAALGARDVGVLGYGVTALSGVGMALGARMLGASAETQQRIASGAGVAVLGRGVVDIAKKVGAAGPLGLSDYTDTGYPGSYEESGTGMRLGIPELDIDGSGLGDYVSAVDGSGLGSFWGWDSCSSIKDDPYLSMRSKTIALRRCEAAQGF